MYAGGIENVCCISQRESNNYWNFSLLSPGGAFTTTVEVEQRPGERYEMHQFNTMDSQGMEERARSEPPQVIHSFGVSMLHCGNSWCHMSSMVEVCCVRWYQMCEVDWIALGWFWVSDGEWYLWCATLNGVWTARVTWPAWAANQAKADRCGWHFKYSRGYCCAVAEPLLLLYEHTMRV